MAIDYERLLGFEIPDVRQTLTPRDAAFYALSVGMAQDPMALAELDFVDQHRGLKALPSMAVVLCHPGFWLRDAAPGVAAVDVLHGEQGIVLHHPLPVEGELVGRSRVTGIVDKGRGKGALLYSQKQILDRDGTLLATTTSTAFVRRAGGFGGPSGPVAPTHPTPQGRPDVVVDLPTRPEQALYYRLNGDDNPLHADPVFAARAGFPRPILHGLCTLGVVAHALLRALCGYDPGRLRAMELRFTSPVFPGETIRTGIWRDGAFRAHVVERDVVVVNNGKVVVR